MIGTRIIDGKAHAARLTGEIAGDVARLQRAHGLQPGLAVVLVGEDPASQVYVRNKGRQTVAAGMRSFEHKLPADISQPALLALPIPGPAIWPLCAAPPTSWSPRSAGRRCSAPTRSSRAPR